MNQHDFGLANLVSMLGLEPDSIIHTWPATLPERLTCLERREGLNALYNILGDMLTAHKGPLQ